MMRAIVWLLCVCLVATRAIAAETFDPSLLEKPAIGAGLIDRSKLLQDDKVLYAGVSGQTGVFVAGVLDGGFAQVAGVKPLDLIVGLNGWRTDEAAELHAAIRTLTPGQSSDVEVVRSSIVDDRLTYAKKSITLSGKVTTRKESLLSRLIVEEDRVSDQKWLHHKHALKSATEATQVKPYFQIVNGAADNLRVVFAVVEKPGHLPHEIGIRANDAYVEFPVPFPNVKLKFGTTGTAYWVDWPVDAKLLKSLLAIAQSGKGVVRFSDRNSQVVDVTLTSKDVMHITDVLVGYKLHGGKIDDSALGWYSLQVRLSDEVAEGVQLRKFEKPIAKPDPPPIPKEKLDPAALLEKRRQEAVKKLDAAKLLSRNGKTEAATKRLKEIIDQYADTPAAKESEELLKKLK